MLNTDGRNNPKFTMRHSYENLVGLVRNSNELHIYYNKKEITQWNFEISVEKYG